MDSVLIAVLTISFFFLLFLGVPISFAIGLSSFFSLLVFFPIDIVGQVLSQKMMTALDSFGLLAIPFFILAGNIMNNGGMAQRLVDFAKLLAFKLPGPLMHCNIIANMLFGAISGSAVSSVAAVGGMMGPIQKKEGYDPNLCAAVNIASCPSGLLIPPSGVLILFSLVSGGTSVAALFIAGYVPGIMMGLGLMIVAGYFASKNGLKAKSEGYTFSEAREILFKAIPSLLLVIIVIGGIIKGIFTATEASAIAVLYSLLLSFAYKEISIKDIPNVFTGAVRTTAIVLFLVGSSVSMSWAMASANIPGMISELINSVSASPFVILLILNVILLVVGTFMDLTPAVLIFTPIFLPIANSIGLDPIHFGIMMIFNLCIGICTPPVGSALFVGCGVAKVPITKVIPHLIPMYVVLFAVLLLITYIPSLSLFLPKMFGL